MNTYAKLVLVGIIGLVVISIVMGVTSARVSPGINFSSGEIDLGLIMFLYLWNGADANMRMILIVLFILGYFYWSSEE